MRPITRSTILAFALVPLFAIGARGADWYVVHDDQTPDPSGQYVNWSVAASNIQDAVNVAAAGDTVWIGKGRYTLPPNATNYVGSNVVYLNKPITLRSSNSVPSTAIIDGGGTNRGIAVRYKSTTSQRFVFDGLIISNCFATNMGGGILFNADNAATWTGAVQNCLIVDNTVAWGGNTGNTADPLRGTSGSRGGGIGQYSFTVGMGVVVSNCVIRNNQALARPSPTTVNHRGFGGGVYVSGYSRFYASDSLIENNTASGAGGVHVSWPLAWIDRCVFRGNFADTGAGEYAGGAIQFGSSGAGAGGVRSRLRNCLFYNNNAQQGGAISVQRGPYLQVDACTIVSNKARLAAGGGGIHLRFSSQGAGLQVWNSIVYSNANNDLNLDSYDNAFFTNICTAITNSLQGANNITNEPVFVDFVNNDYQLKSGSPCVNRGTNRLDWMQGAVDLAGNPRIDSGIVDMGCYEYQTYGTLISIH